MFPTTQHASEIDLLRVSEFHRRQTEFEDGADTEAGSTRLSSLNPSLLQDLMRFNEPARVGEGLEVLEVLAAAVRHARALLLHLEHEPGRRVFSLTVFPVQHQVHAPITSQQLLALPLQQLRVLHVEPARMSVDDDPAGLSPLQPLLWELALRGSREQLLPEISAQAAYRIAPAAEQLNRLHLSGSLASAVARLRRETTNLRDLSQWPGFDRERAMRMLNGLYLQAALMISRTHPSATNEGWIGGLR